MQTDATCNIQLDENVKICWPTMFPRFALGLTITVTLKIFFGITYNEFAQFYSYYHVYIFVPSFYDILEEYDPERFVLPRECE